LTCASLRRDGEERAALCQTMRERLDLEPIAATAFASRLYDPVNSGYTVTGADGRSHTHATLPEGTPVELTAFRVRGDGA
jgi:hypothetical protein